MQRRKISKERADIDKMAAAAVQLEPSPSCRLCTTIEAGRLEDVRKQIQADQDVCRCERRMPVYRAIKLYQRFLSQSRTDSMAKALVWKSADVYQSNTRSLVLQTVAKLLAGGAALNYTTGVETPLMAALSTCDEDLLWTLLDFKADVNQCDGVEDMNALGLAILLNEVALVEMLIKYGGKVNAPCCGSLMPIDLVKNMALTSQQQYCPCPLQVNTRCCGSLMPIQLAMNKKSAISSLLIQSGADVHLLRTISLDDKPFTSQSPLLVALQRNNIHLARLLLEHGEDVNQTFPDSLESPIHLAVRNSHVHMVDLLVQFGADLNKPNFERHTPVGLALLMDKPVATEMAKQLVLSGASPNRRTRISFFQKMYAPLHIACFKGNFEFVRFLVEEVCGRMGDAPVETQAPESSDVSIKDRFIVTRDNYAANDQNRFFKRRNQRPGGAAEFEHGDASYRVIIGAIAAARARYAASSDARIRTMATATVSSAASSDASTGTMATATVSSAASSDTSTGTMATATVSSAASSDTSTGTMATATVSSAASSDASTGTMATATVSSAASSDTSTGTMATATVSSAASSDTSTVTMATATVSSAASSDASTGTMATATVSSAASSDASTGTMATATVSSAASSDTSTGTMATVTVSSAASSDASTGTITTAVSGAGVDSSSNACSDTGSGGCPATGAGSGSSSHTGGGLGSAASKTNRSDAIPRVSSNSSIVSSERDGDNERVRLRCGGDGVSRPDSGSSKSSAECESSLTDGATGTGSSHIKPEPGLGGAGDFSPASAQQSSTEASPDSTAGQSSATSMINVEASRADNSEQGSRQGVNQGGLKRGVRADWMYRFTANHKGRHDRPNPHVQASSNPASTSPGAGSVEVQRERDASVHPDTSELSQSEDESEVKTVDPETLSAEAGTRFAQCQSGTTGTDTDNEQECHHKRLDHGASSPRFVKSRSGSRSAEGGELRSLGTEQTGDKSGRRKPSPSKRAEQSPRVSMGEVECSGGAAWGHASVRDSLRRDDGSLQSAGEPGASIVMEPAKGGYFTAAEMGLRILNPPTTAWSPTDNLTASSSATATTPNCEDTASKEGTEGAVSATLPANTLASADNTSSLPQVSVEPIFQVEFGAPGYEIPEGPMKEWQDKFLSERKEEERRGRAAQDEQRRRLEGDVDEDTRSNNVTRFLNQEGSDGCTALFMAVYDGNVQLVNYLLDHGANPFFNSHHGNFFHAAVLSQNVPLIRRALELGCAINQHNVFGNSPLTLVARLDLPEACELLVTHGADMNSRDRYGETPLLASVYFGCEMNARTLIQHGANLNLLDDNHTSAIYWTIFNNRQHTLKLLLMAGAHFSAHNFSQYPRNIRVMHNKDLLSFVDRYVHQPRSLQDLATIGVRKHLGQVHEGRSILPHVQCLPIPAKLKRMLSLDYFIAAIDLDGPLPTSRR